MSAYASVVLPEPLRPMIACTSPCPTDQVDAAQDLAAAIGDGHHVQVADDQRAVVGLVVIGPVSAGGGLVLHGLIHASFVANCTSPE